MATQHLLGTTIVEVQEGACQAKSLAYFQASHFGLGEKTGQVWSPRHLEIGWCQAGCGLCNGMLTWRIWQVLYAYAQYQDEWIKVGDQWRIKLRTLAYIVCDRFDQGFSALPQDICNC